MNQHGTRTLWRISDHADLSGWGSLKFASRWASRGHRLVYAAESPAGAMLEILAHLEFEDGELPDDYRLIEIAVPDGLAIRELEPPRSPLWKQHPRLTQHVGDRWLKSRQTPLARVPSAIMPRTWNILLNPEHPDAEKIRITSMIRERFDNRLFRFGGN